MNLFLDSNIWLALYDIAELQAEILVEEIPPISPTRAGSLRGHRIDAHPGPS